MVHTLQSYNNNTSVCLCKRSRVHNVARSSFLYTAALFWNERSSAPEGLISTGLLGMQISNDNLNVSFHQTVPVAPRGIIFFYSICRYVSFDLDNVISLTNNKPRKSSLLLSHCLFMHLVVRV